MGVYEALPLCEDYNSGREKVPRSLAVKCEAAKLWGGSPREANRDALERTQDGARGRRSFHVCE